MYCRHCGKEIQDQLKYCPYCGGKIAQEAEMKSNVAPGSDSYKNQREYIGQNCVDMIRYAVDKNPDHYERKFRQIEEKRGGGASWCGLIFPYWAFYRKMYVEAIVFTIANTILTLLGSGVGMYMSTTLDFSPWLVCILIGVLQLVVIILCITNANTMYYRKICNEISNYRLTGRSVEEPDVQNDIYHLHTRTGVNMSNTVFFVIVIAVLGSVCNYVVSKQVLNYSLNHTYTADSTKQSSTSVDLKDYLGTSQKVFYEKENITDDVMEQLDQGLYIDCYGDDKDIITMISLSNNTQYNLFGMECGMSQDEANTYLPRGFKYDKENSIGDTKIAYRSGDYYLLWTLNTDNNIDALSYIYGPAYDDTTASTPEPTEDTTYDDGIYDDDTYDDSDPDDIYDDSTYDDYDDSYNDSYDDFDDSYTDEYVIPDSDTVKLTKSDVNGLTKEELRLARNEIYARHGRRFSDNELQDYFDSCDWYDGYIDPEDFVDSEELSKLERKNIKLIQKYENR